jgi:ABC exporter DevB family membrane fusion protein
MPRHHAPRALPAFALALALAACGKATPPAPAATGPGGSTDIIAAPGLVEPAGEERVIIPEMGGRLKRVLIAEGDRVEAGAVIAEIENADYIAAVAAADALVALREAELARLVAGTRSEEIDAAEAAAREARAAAQLARQEHERRQRMHAAGQIAAEALEQAAAARSTAEARADGAEARLALARAGARAEDRAVAEAALAAARADAEQARARYEKTLIRAPIAGVVLKRDLREGETVVALSPLPLARIGDIATLYVRANIDELDIARIRTGQRAEVTTDAWPDRRYVGEVVHVARRMGRRSVESGNPAERIDAKVLEAMIRLDPGADLPVGLRVDVKIAVSP